MSLARLAVVAALAACSSKSRAVEDARSAQPPAPRDAAPAVTVPSGPYRAEASFAKGDVQIRVEWHDVPTAARASPGRTPCGTPHTAAVAPTTTWGIPDAIVMIDADHGKAPVDPQARVVLDHCALVPRVVLAGARVTVASAADQPAQLAFARTQPARPLEVHVPDKVQAIPIQLPVAGHAVTAALVTDTIYTLAAGDETATIVAGSSPYYAVTEASGQVVLRDVPVGTFAVFALIPARAGEPARAGRGTVTVAANALAEVTIDVTPKAP